MSDTWDMKPEAPASIAGPFQRSRLQHPVFQLLWHLAFCFAKAGFNHLAVDSLRVFCCNGEYDDHHAGYYYNLTCTFPTPPLRRRQRRRPYADDWPFMDRYVGSRSDRTSHGCPMRYVASQTKQTSATRAWTILPLVGCGV